jgi:hypothetical protein
LRPRAPALVLAGWALILWAVVERLAPRAPAWLGARLEGAFAGQDPALGLDPRPLALGLLALLGVGAGVALVFGGRRSSPRSLGVSTRLGEIPPWLALGSCVAALVVLVANLRPALAGAARSVDAGGVSALWGVWFGWLGRGLLALAAVAAALGVIERLASARSLWQGLHLTRTQARERARASGERRR